MSVIGRPYVVALGRDLLKGVALMAMPIEDCFAVLAARWSDELVVTSAGNSSEVWWETTGDTEKTFYLEASMSLSTMFAAGLAMGYPDARVWAFLGDGAFVMNTGLLFVERDLALPNMVSIIVANRCYGATDSVDLPTRRDRLCRDGARGRNSNVFRFTLQSSRPVSTRRFGGPDRRPSCWSSIRPTATTRARRSTALS